MLPSQATARPVQASLPHAQRGGAIRAVRDLAPQEALLILLGQLSALMDTKDTPDWTINPAYHPAVNAFIAQHAGNRAFVTRARALQKNRAPYYGKTVVAGPRRRTILAGSRTTALDPPRTRSAGSR